MGYHEYKECIEACLACASVCNHCASECLKEDNIAMMADCIQNDMECAAICYTAAQVMSMGGSKAKELCKLCVDVCTKCAEECGKHDNEHCKECADACSKCAEICGKMAA